jgi:hypothetical protein
VDLSDVAQNWSIVGPETTSREKVTWLVNHGGGCGTNDVLANAADNHVE